MTHTPVIITGLVSQMTSVPWTLEHIKTVGEVQFKNKVDNICSFQGCWRCQCFAEEGSVEWAGLECAENMKVADFITSLENNSHGKYVCALS